MHVSHLLPRLVIIVGATGIGKTQLAMQLARSWGGDIISADSMQVYRYMDIGTAKPGKSEQNIVPHHLIDVVDPDETFNAAMYINLARKIIETSVNRDNRYFVVGGTGLYIKVLLGGLLSGPGADEDLRNYYRQQLERFGREYLYRLLKEKDALAARRIDSHDTNRIIRALEVWEQCGKSIVEKQRDHRFGEQHYDYLKVGLKMERKLLYARIEERTEEMLRRGFIDEVKWLLEKGYPEGLKSMQSLGYRHMVNYLCGLYSLEEATYKMKSDTRQYAKRQETWFRADREIHWFNHDDLSAVTKIIDRFMT